MCKDSFFWTLTNTLFAKGCIVAGVFGATFLVVVDINEDRVQFAVKEGFATKGLVLPVGNRAENTAERLSKSKATATEILQKYMSESDGFDVVLECSGVESCMQTAIHVRRDTLAAMHHLSLSLTFLSIVCETRRQSRLHWDGYTECDFANQRGRFPRSGSTRGVSVL